jgi:hypothetical protein
MLIHRPPVKIVCVQITNVRIWFGFIVILRFYIRIVCSRKPIADDRYPAAHATFKKCKHFGIGYQIQTDLCMFQTGIPRQGGGGDVLRGMELVRFQRQISKIFKYVVSRKSIESISDRCDCFVLFPACRYCVTNSPILFVVFAEVRCVVAWRPGHPPPRVHSLSRVAASLRRPRRVQVYRCARVCK